MICSSIFNSQRTDSKQKVLSPTDFMPKFEQKEVKVEKPKVKDVVRSEDFQNKARLFRMMMS